MSALKILLSLLAILILTEFEVQATDLVISNVRVVNRPKVQETPLSVFFDIKWDNAWNNPKNHDAAWVFMKFNDPWNNHVKLIPDGHRVINTRSGIASEPEIEVSRDSTGFFIYPKGIYRGSADYKVQILIDTTNQPVSRARLSGLKVYAIEMVYIPEAEFTLGSPDSAAFRKAALYSSDEKGNPRGLFTISSEQPIQVGPHQDHLYYWSEEELYNGDQVGPIPAEFPKGYSPFYIMKYELTQGQYADFLNDLPEVWTSLRSPIGGREYYKNRGGLRLVNGKYLADSPKRPMNYLSFTDALAYTDWAAMRPVTELEYEKACRGPSAPIPAEFVWGTDNYDQLERYVTSDSELVMVNGRSEAELSDETRSVFGASYYWVMDLSGSLWEKVITIGNSKGRAFRGTHGDGQLHFGNATNNDWPDSDNEEGGFGYRGGGYYEFGTNYSDFNPHSPIGYRYYGAWSGGPRSKAYGYRAGRTAPISK